MTSRIGFFQYELSHPENAPHVGMCLLLRDLREAGRDVDAALVHAGAVPALLERIAEREYGLLAFDSIFTVEIVDRVKAAFPSIPVLVGGTNALPLLLFSRADFAIVGAARRAVPAFVRALEAGAGFAGVPNLFFRRADGVIDRSGLSVPWTLDEELQPYDPDFAWDYIGPVERDPASNTRFVSVVPELGCGFQKDALAAEPYREVPRGTAGSLLSSLALSGAARAALDPFLENTRGCAFCAFRYQTYTIDRAEETAERGARQIATIAERYGVTAFSVQSENPFRFLPALLRALRRDGVPVHTLLARTFPAVLARKPESVIEGFEAARAAGVRLELQQLGFENFSAEELVHLGKGLSPEENIAAARLLYEIHRRFGDDVEVFRGHGFILFTPWTTPEELVTNVRVIATEAPFLAGSLSVGSRLVFYDPWNPIFRLAEAQGLVLRTTSDYTLGYRFADDRTTHLCRLAMALEHTLVARGVPPSRQLSRAILTSAIDSYVSSPDLPDDERFRAVEAASARAYAEDDARWRAPQRRMTGR